METLQCIGLSVSERRTACDAKHRTSIRESSRKARKTITESARYQPLHLWIATLKLLHAVLLPTHPLFAVTKQQPVLPLTLAYPSAACTATVSCLVSISSMPASEQPIKKASR